MTRSWSSPRKAGTRGVLGIVASRVLGQCYRPTIIIGVDGAVARGSGPLDPRLRSARSAQTLRPGISTISADIKWRPGWGWDTDQIGPFREAINLYARNVLSPDLMCPLVLIDANARPEDLTPEMITPARPTGSLRPR